jgi:hypothetical protein
MVSRKHKPTRRFAILTALSLLLMAALWIVFVGGTQKHEMDVGAGVLLLSAAFLYTIWQTETLKLDMRVRDLLQGWRIPWNILIRDCQMIAILAKDLAGMKPAGSFYRVTGFRNPGSAPRFAGWRFLATAYTTTAPNFIVIGIYPQQKRMLFHQLERSTVPKMTQALGAEPELAQP